MKPRSLALLPLFFVGLGACGSRTKHTSEASGPTPTPPVTPTTTLDLKPVAMKAASVFQMTAEMSQWQMNSVTWDDAKGKEKGLASFANLMLLPGPGESPVAHYQFGMIEQAQIACDDADKTVVTLYLDTLAGASVKETREFPQDTSLSVDLSQFTYNLRVEVANDGNCSADDLQLAIAAQP